jgi:hypothetical protein
MPNQKCQIILIIYHIIAKAAKILCYQLDTRCCKMSQVFFFFLGISYGSLIKSTIVKIVEIMRWPLFGNSLVCNELNLSLIIESINERQVFAKVGYTIIRHLFNNRVKSQLKESRVPK